MKPGKRGNFTEAVEKTNQIMTHSALGYKPSVPEGDMPVYDLGGSNFERRTFIGGWSHPLYHCPTLIYRGCHHWPLGKF